MAVKAAYENYTGPSRDAVENFHGNQLVYIGWDGHMMFPCAEAYPLPPQMPFGALVKEVVPTAFSVHPDFANINWDKVEWLLDGKSFGDYLKAKSRGQKAKRPAPVALGPFISGT